MKKIAFFFIAFWRVTVCLLATGWLRFTLLRMGFWCWISKEMTAHIQTLYDKATRRSAYLTHRILLMRELGNVKQKGGAKDFPKTGVLDLKEWDDDPERN